MAEPTVEEMAEEIAKNTTQCPSDKNPMLHMCLTTSCSYCWSQAPESEIRTRYQQMKGERG